MFISDLAPGHSMSWQENIQCSTVLTSKTMSLVNLWAHGSMRLRQRVCQTYLKSRFLYLGFACEVSCKLSRTVLPINVVKGFGVYHFSTQCNRDQMWMWNVPWHFEQLRQPALLNLSKHQSWHCRWSCHRTACRYFRSGLRLHVTSTIRASRGGEKQ